MLGLLPVSSTELVVPPPGTLALFGVLLGGNAYLIFSKPLARPSKRS
jgi:hypothetical protein